MLFSLHILCLFFRCVLCRKRADYLAAKKVIMVHVHGLKMTVHVFVFFLPSFVSLFLWAYAINFCCKDSIFAS